MRVGGDGGGLALVVRVGLLWAARVRCLLDCPPLWAPNSLRALHCSGRRTANYDGLWRPRRQGASESAAAAGGVNRTHQDQSAHPCAILILIKICHNGSLYI